MFVFLLDWFIVIVIVPESAVVVVVFVVDDHKNGKIEDMREYCKSALHVRVPRTQYHGTGT